MEYQTIAQQRGLKHYGIMRDVAHNPPHIKYPPLVKKPRTQILKDLFSFFGVAAVMAVAITTALS